MKTKNITIARTLLIVGIGALAPFWWAQSVAQTIFKISGVMNAQKSDVAYLLCLYMFLALIAGLLIGLIMVLMSKLTPLNMTVIFVASWLAAKALLGSLESAFSIFNDLGNWMLVIGILCSSFLYKKIKKNDNL